MPNQKQKQAAEKRYLENGETLRTLAAEMGVYYETLKRWSREGGWADKKRQARGTARGMSAKEKQLSRLMEASDEIEEALQMAATGLKRRMAEDPDGAEIADGKFRAGNLNSIAHAIDRQTKTRILLSSVKSKEGNKENGAISVRLSDEVKKLTE